MQPSPHHPLETALQGGRRVTSYPGSNGMPSLSGRNAGIIFRSGLDGICQSAFNILRLLG